MNYCRIPLRMPRAMDELLPKESKLRFALADNCFEEFLSVFPWRLNVCRTVNTYAMIKGKSSFMHNLVKPSPSDFEVDHAGCNALDNRWRSLRWATRWQNTVNRRVSEGAASAYKGVRPDRGNWESVIALKHLPEHMTNSRGGISCSHQSEIQSALWYEAIARQAYGEWHTGSFDNVSDAALLGAAIAEGVELVNASDPGELPARGGGRRRIYNTLSPEDWMQRVTKKRRADRAEIAKRQQKAFDYAKIHGLPGHPIRECKVTLEELQGDIQ